MREVEGKKKKRRPIFSKKGERAAGKSKRKAGKNQII